MGKYQAERCLRSSTTGQGKNKCLCDLSSLMPTTRTSDSCIKCYSALLLGLALLRVYQSEGQIILCHFPHHLPAPPMAGMQRKIQMEAETDMSLSPACTRDSNLNCSTQKMGHTVYYFKNLAQKLGIYPEYLICWVSPRTIFLPSSINSIYAVPISARSCAELRGCHVLPAELKVC